MTYVKAVEQLQPYLYEDLRQVPALLKPALLTYAMAIDYGGSKVIEQVIINQVNAYRRSLGKSELKEKRSTVIEFTPLREQMIANKEFNDQVKNVMDILDENGELWIKTRKWKGMSSNVDAIAEGLARTGWKWITPAHVVEAQQRITNPRRKH